MMEISVREARARISELLDIVEQAEKVVITRHGKPSVRLVIATNETTTKSLPDLSDFRAAIDWLTETELVSAISKQVRVKAITKVDAIKIINGFTVHIAAGYYEI